MLMAILLGMPFERSVAMAIALHLSASAVVEASMQLPIFPKYSDFMIWWSMTSHPATTSVRIRNGDNGDACRTIKERVGCFSVEF